MIPKPWVKKKIDPDAIDPTSRFYECEHCRAVATPLMITTIYDPDTMHHTICPWIYRQYFKLKKKHNV